MCKFAQAQASRQANAQAAADNPAASSGAPATQDDKERAARELTGQRLVLELLLASGKATEHSQRVWQQQNDLPEQQKQPS